MVDVTTDRDTAARATPRAPGGRPVIGWAALGALLALLTLWILGRWLAAGGIGSVDPGPDHFGGTKLVAMRVLEWGQLAVMLGIAWVFGVRPLVARRGLGFDGLLILAAVALNVWDPLDNYAVFAFQYNAHHVNVSSWGGYIPGWRSEQPELWAVPVGFVFGAYVWAFFAAARWGCAILDWAGRRRPSWGPWRRWGLVFAANALIAGAAEIAYLQTGAITNLRTPDALTLWDDSLTRFPVYNPFLFSAAWTAIVALRWSRDAHGHSFVERGVRELALGPRTRTLVRYLAISAYMQVAYIGLYFLPFNLLALLGDDPFPRPSYFPVP